MSKSRPPAAANRALPYKPHPSNPPPPPPPPPPRSRRALPYFVGASAIYIFSAYSFYLYKTLSAEPSPLPQDTDVSPVYSTTAPSFDRDVGFTESVTGILRERKKLMKKARGHVLEVSAGTGRNSKYYDLKKCSSVTLVDLSSEMMQLCRQKWKLLYPEYAPVSFHTQSALLPLPAPPPGKGYTTILQTFGLCSTPHPAALLRHLGTLLDKDGGRILLLEHGRGYYRWVNWVLDRTAGRHAERHGCWWNRDLEGVVRESGLVVVGRRRRRHLGTLWVWELRVPGRGEGRGEMGKAKEKQYEREERDETGERRERGEKQGAG